MALREIFANLGFTFDGAKLKEADRGVEGLIEKVQGLASAFAGGLIASGINRLAAELDVFDDLSARTGVAVQDLQALGLAFETSGSSAEEMQGALTRLQSSLGGLSDGGKEQAEVFKKLGIATKDAAGKAPDLATALPEIFKNFSSITSEAEQARVATTLFGRTGVKLLPVLRQGAQGFEGMRAQLEAIGGGATQEATEAAGAYRDALARLHYSFFSLKSLLATSVFPRLQQVVDMSAKAVGSFAAWAKNTTLVDSAAGILATTLAFKLASALAPYLKSGLKFAAIFLAIDDLLAFLQGKDSLIGSLLNAAFGEGAADAVRGWVNDAIFEFQRFLASGEAALSAWEDANASTWAKVLAAWATGWNDLLGGFPVFRAEAEETFAGIGNSFLSMVIGLEESWNGFVGGLALPDFVKTALKIDTSAEANALSANQNRQQAARERSTAAFGGPVPASNPSRVRVAVAPGSTAPAFEGSSGSSAATLLAAAHGRPEVKANYGPYAPGAAPSFSMVQNAPITVNLPAGTPTTIARQTARAVAEGVRDANRSAKQALTQRGEK